jgi:hypothetical protein
MNKPVMRLTEEGDILAPIVPWVAVAMVSVDVRECAADFARFDLEPTHSPLMRRTQGCQLIRQHADAANQSASLSRSARHAAEATTLCPAQIEVSPALLAELGYRGTPARAGLMDPSPYAIKYLAFNVNRRRDKDRHEEVSIGPAMRPIPDNVILQNRRILADVATPAHNRLLSA